MTNYDIAYGKIVGALADHCAEQHQMITLLDKIDERDIALLCIIDSEEANFRAIKKFIEKAHSLEISPKYKRIIMYAYIDAAEEILEEIENKYGCNTL